MAILKIRNTANTAWLNVGNSVDNAIQDTDGDTLVTTQRDDDDDTIRFDAGGSQDLITVTSSAIAGSLIADEDDMISDDAGLLCTQQSIKAYNDALVWTYFGGVALTGDTHYTLDATWDTNYIAWRYVFSSVKPSVNNCPVMMQVQRNDTTWSVSGYVGAGTLMNAAGTAMTTGFMAINAAYHDAAMSGYGIYELYKNVGSQGRMHFQGSYGVTSGATQYQGRGCGFISLAAPACTGIRIKPYVNAASWTAGVVYVWGLRYRLI